MRATRRVTDTAAEVRRDPLLGAVIGAFPGGIEAQEARGQGELVASDTLPTEGLEAFRKVIEAAGGSIASPVKCDEMFTVVVLPAGWKKEGTDHSMWSNLVDAKGRKRAAIFYKAAFYDRSAFITPTRCITCERDYEIETELVYRVLRNGAEVLHEIRRPKPGGRELFRAEDSIRAEVVAWMNEHFPQHEDLNAYWECHDTAASPA